MAVTHEQQQEIAELRSKPSSTHRKTVQALEDVLYQPLPVLDHGFVRVVDYMGDDSAIVQAARVSYGKGTKQVNQDQGLINYLMRHRHSTPFEMCEIKFHIKLPIFIARQWIRHRTANVNEYSARYSILDKEFYIPAPEHVAAQSKQNNQGRDNKPLNAQETAQVLQLLKRDSEQCYATYEELLNLDPEGNTLDSERTGLARELARMNLTLNYYTQWYWKVDLHNLMHFLSLRADPHAQYEIRAYANVMLDILQRWVPITAAAFTNYRLQGAHISGKGMDAIRRMIQGENVTQETSGLTKREWEELLAVLKVPQLQAA